MWYILKRTGYVKKDTPRFHEHAAGKRRQSLKRLYRLGTLMTELENEDIADWEKELENEDGEAKSILPRRIPIMNYFPNPQSVPARGILRP